MKRKKQVLVLVKNKKMKMELSLVNVFKDTLFYFLPGNELMKCSRVCKDWHLEIKKESIWRKAVFNECGYVKNLKDYGKINSFYELYKYFYSNSILKKDEQIKNGNIEGNF